MLYCFLLKVKRLVVIFLHNMVIGIDIRMWSATGIGTYVRHLVKELILLNTKHEFVLFGSSSLKDEITSMLPLNWKYIDVDIPWYGYKEQIQLPFVYNSHSLDVLHVPHFNVPILFRGKCVVTLHDLTHSTFVKGSTTHSGVKHVIKRLGYRVSVKNALKHSAKIIVPSEYVQNQIVLNHPELREKITVTHEASDPCTVIPSDKLIRVLSDFGISKPYFFYIGNAHPHKNLETLLKSFAKLRDTHPDIELVLAGDDSYFWPRLKKYSVIEHLNGNVKFVGKVSDYERDALYRGALAYVFPSLSEGFGLPLLESMSCGCPVISSNSSSLSEIAGQAVLFCDPTDIESFVTNMKVIIEDPEVRNTLRSRGFKRVHMFSWKKMAQQTLSVYESVY
jgi:glycosyltransferase involved in cell wall biosynthesis